MIIADKVISSEAVFTGLEDETRPATLAIKGNKILAIGTKEDIKSFIGPETKEYHFGNQLIMSGFHDAHLHLMFGSLFTHASVDLSGARSSEEVVTLVKGMDFWLWLGSNKMGGKRISEPLSLG